MNFYYDESAKKIGAKFKTFNPFEIAEKLNIDIKYKDFKLEPKGETIRYFNRPIIILDDSLINSDMKYFVCAHELCHAIKHTDQATYYISNCIIKNKFEYQADNFAKTLLTYLYKEQYDELPETYSKIQIAYGL
ncbi:ImmA/IrrE family metallo-endopeptidase [Fructilactobacillus cliffordii]|uniref:ImmA/IrrE family metallo-endopeptidase n=1 Tax=Fructilactobacillus cliffordii TaxID=2940299 RepID=A0A9Q8ZYN9_9LACO|nr:ImmA/IrrE family metallo-endopeptidase [Fructilactobacillus cliffordii]USS89986.1 ImmA/IrrE family metallo-endopeptidase [Fructilactobacillus cliffordii]